MERLPVTSSNIIAAGYDSSGATFEVEFKTKPGKPKAIYRYTGVPKATYDAFLAAESKGQFLSRSIVGKFPHTRVEGHDV